ncbi:MAG: nicotinamide-nucleotide amidase [Acidimicrobiaceae bacterium]|nr:nicotinamide-nucleotide amidase [Acidimicrobiaceae bacterium]
MLPADLLLLGERAGALLRDRGDTVSVAEGSAGGLVSAALLAVRGASAYYVGGTVVYTMAAKDRLVAGAVEAPEGMRGATEEFALYLARSIAERLATTWGIGEAGAAGPGNRYGDPAGHGWVAVAGPSEATRHALTGVDDRPANMVAFASAALTLLVDTLDHT